jgi:hypothetical protein
MEPPLGLPGAVDDITRCAALSQLKGAALKWVMAILPRGFDQDAAQMGVAGFSDGSARLIGATRVFRRDQTGKCHEARGGGEAAGITQFRGNGQGGEIVDAAEAPKALDT